MIFQGGKLYVYIVRHAMITFPVMASVAKASHSNEYSEP
jgi:hypothetical protein